jgi:hypothetical protein
LHAERNEYDRQRSSTSKHDVYQRSRLHFPYLPFL